MFYIILGVGIVVLISVLLLYKELIYITFDEEAARVGGIPTKLINNIFIVFGRINSSFGNSDCRYSFNLGL